MKLFLHLGYVKTGSSAIQTSLAFNKDLLETHGACLPIAPQHLNTQKKGIASAGNGKLLKNAICSGSLDSVVDLIKYDVDANKEYESFIYSSELLFYTLADLKNFQMLKKALNIIGFTKLSLLLFVRNPASHAISWHGEMTKSGMTTSSITEFINNYNHPAGMVRLVRLVDKIRDEGLSVKLEFRNYSYLRGKVVDIAWDWLGIPVPIKTLPSSNPINRSLTESEGELCRQLAKSGCNPKSFASSFSLSLPNLKPTYPKPTLESLNNMYSRHLENLLVLNDFLPANERLALSVADEDIETSSAPNNEYLFSSEQLLVIAQTLASYLKER